jgi:hypothetical protein
MKWERKLMDGCIPGWVLVVEALLLVVALLLVDEIASVVLVVTLELVELETA